MIKCNTCSKSVPADSEFCPFCGNKIVIVKETPASSDTLYSSDPKVLITRAFLFLEEGLFDKADVYTELVLTREPENAQAYLAKLLLDYNAKTLDDLTALEETFEDNINYKRVIKYGDEELEQKLLEIHNTLIAKIEKLKEEEAIRQEIYCIETYKKAKQLMSDLEEVDYGKTIDNLTEAIKLFKDISEYKDSKELQNECELVRNYKLACLHLASRDTDKLKKAIEIFEKIIDYKDSKEKIKECEELIELDRFNERRIKRWAIIAISVYVAILAIAILAASI